MNWTWEEWAGFILMLSFLGLAGFILHIPFWIIGLLAFGLGWLYGDVMRDIHR